MSNWMEARERNFDSFGLLLYRLAGLIVGFGIGLMVAYHYPPKSWSISVFVLVLGGSLACLAIYRTKTADENRLELRTK